MFYRWGGIFGNLCLRCEGSSLMGMCADTVRNFSTGSIHLYSGDRNGCFLSIPRMCGHTLDMLCWRRPQSNCRGNIDIYYNAVTWFWLVNCGKCFRIITAKPYIWPLPMASLCYFHVSCNNLWFQMKALVSDCCENEKKCPIFYQFNLLKQYQL